MKRFAGYLSLCVSVVTAVLVGVVPTILGTNGSGDYSSSNKYVFKVSNKQVSSSEFSDGTNNGLTYDENGNTPAEDISNEFKVRLGQAGITGYQLATINDDIIELTFKDSQNIYTDVIDFLTYSNSLMAKTYDGEYSFGFSASEIYNGAKPSNSTFLKPGTARVEYRDNYPYVIMDLNSPEEFNNAIKSLTQTSSDSDSNRNAGELLRNTIRKAGESTSEEEETPKVDPKKAIFVLNNWLNDFTLEGLLNNSNGNITNDNFHNYVLTYFNAAEPSKIYWDYDSSLSSEDQNKKIYESIYFSFYNLGAANGEGCLDVTTSYSLYNVQETDPKLAYRKANILMNKLNSSDYKYQITLINESKVNEGTNTVSPFKEYLKRAGSVNLSTLLISTIIAAIIVFLFLILHYGAAGILSFALSLGNVIGSLALFNFLGNEFNIGTIIGLFGVALITLITTIQFMHKAKEEVYAGKALKKAYQESGKKNTWLLLDVSVITVILGLTCYLIQNANLIAFGGITIIGAIINVLLSGIVFRGFSWFLYNSDFASKHPRVLQIEPKLIPDLTKEEKAKYFDEFKRGDSKRTFKVYGIAGLVLLVASIVGITTFQIVNGNIYNSTETSKYNSVTVQYNLVNANDEFIVDNKILKIEEAFDDIYKDQDLSTKYFKADSISVDSYYNEYLAGETNPIKYREYYFVVDLGSNYDFDTSVYYSNGDSKVADKLGNVIKTSIQSKLDTNYLVSINETKNVSDDFNNKDVAIAAAITVAILFAYFILRFGPSKALTALLVGASLLTISIGIFSLIRGNFTSELTLGLLLITLLTYISFALYFIDEQALVRENKKELSDLDKRQEKFEYSANITYKLVFNIALFAIFIVISFFFSTSLQGYTLLYFIVSLILSSILIKGTALPIEMFFSRSFKKIFSKKPNIVINKKGKQKADDDGPQEAIFIGIND